MIRLKMKPGESLCTITGTFFIFLASSKPILTASSDDLAPLVISTSFIKTVRIEKMIADDFIRPAGCFGYFGYADVRGIGCQNSVFRGVFVKVSHYGLFDFQFFGNSFNNEIRIFNSFGVASKMWKAPRHGFPALFSLFL